MKVLSNAMTIVVAVGLMVNFASVSAQPLVARGTHATSVPLMIQAQGSFAVGGTVIRNPGTFDPARPGVEVRACMVTTLGFFTRSR